MRQWREMSEQMAAAAQELMVSSARATPRALSQPLARYSEQLLAVSTAMTDPMRRLLDEQAKLVERMADWAEQHRKLSEQVAGWARQQQELSERMDQLARPFLDQSSMLERLHAAWTGTDAEDAETE
jgi:hypothetical protein